MNKWLLLYVTQLMNWELAKESEQCALTQQVVTQVVEMVHVCFCSNGACGEMVHVCFFVTPPVPRSLVSDNILYTLIQPSICNVADQDMEIAIKICRLIWRLTMSQMG